MRIAYQIAALPLLIALPVSALAQDGRAADADVSITGLNLLRPAVEDAMRPARTQISIHIAMPPAHVVGLGPDSQITRLEDDTGHSLLVEHGPAEEDRTEPFSAPPGLTWRNPSPSRAASGFLRRDDFSIGGREGWLEVSVDAPEIPAEDATYLMIAGEIDVLVAGEEESRHQVENIDLSDGEATFEIADETVTCMRDRSLTEGDQTVTEFYCWSESLQPREVLVVGQDDAPPSPEDRANLVVVGDTGDLTLEVAFPVSETVPVTFEQRIGIGL
ncbi:MAG: hypothetical protein JJU21_02605 [Salinarimonas sp.]|nr:hypothetical protein [Salinarimonas sp.]